MKANKKDTELEDLFNEEKYKEYLRVKWIDITNGKFKNQAKKWSDRINEIATLSGIDFTETLENEFEQKIQDFITDFSPDFFTEDGYKLLSSIIVKVKSDLKNMSILR